MQTASRAALQRRACRSCCLVRAQASGGSRECNVCGIHLQCARLVECGCRLAGVEWLRCALAGWSAADGVAASAKAAHAQWQSNATSFTSRV